MLPTLVIAPKVYSAIVVIAGVISAEYYAHKHMKPYASKITKSYHVTFNDVFVWPLSTFGDYCIFRRIAMKEFNKCVKDNPNSNYKLVAYPAVVKGFLFPRVLGITGEAEVLNSYRS